jgi:hypothetical protein
MWRDPSGLAPEKEKNGEKLQGHWVEIQINHQSTPIDPCIVYMSIYFPDWSYAGYDCNWDLGNSFFGGGNESVLGIKGSGGGGGSANCGDHEYNTKSPGWFGITLPHFENGLFVPGSNGSKNYAGKGPFFNEPDLRIIDKSGVLFESKKSYQFGSMNNNDFGSISLDYLDLFLTELRQNMLYPKEIKNGGQYEWSSILTIQKQLSTFDYSLTAINVRTNRYNDHVFFDFLSNIRAGMLIFGDVHTHGRTNSGFSAQDLLSLSLSFNGLRNFVSVLFTPKADYFIRVSNPELFMKQCEINQKLINKSARSQLEIDAIIPKISDFESWGLEYKVFSK